MSKLVSKWINLDDTDAKSLIGSSIPMSLNDTTSIKDYVDAGGGSTPATSTQFNEIVLTTDEITAGFHDHATFNDWVTESTSGGFGDRHAMPNPVFLNGYWWMVGGYDTTYSAKVFKSLDGITWSLVTSSPGFAGRYGHSLFSYDDKLWVAAGYASTGRKNDVWNSTDGESWSQVTVTSGFSARVGQAGVVFDNKMFIIGGQYGNTSWTGDVYSSTDGAIWTQETLGAFTGRAYHSAVVFGDKIYIAGGTGVASSTIGAEIFSSTNGSSWSSVTNPGWSYRQGAGLAVANGKMFMVGGKSGVTVLDDAWLMDVNETWVHMPDPGFNVYGHAMMTHASKVLVLGGTNGTVNTADIHSYSGDITIYDPKKMQVLFKSGTDNIEIFRNQDRAQAGSSCDFVLDGTKIYFKNADGHTFLTGKPAAGDILIVDVLA